ncbi:dnaJ homolog subfamily C member 22 [Condylostylus longicornis]|uniref:dnaJ homolog subfamily C member 22 n=1 Tax=Condylostylus longicornis TaxID=2530218 RepID=UPI00244DE86C|nr:dnaJ homolog subfamily C member 22 [Condylostylus longicornis]
MIRRATGICCKKEYFEFVYNLLIIKTLLHLKLSLDLNEKEHKLNMSSGNKFGFESIQKESTQKLNNKSIVIAYLLWLFGGIFGAHHLYLRRDRHAFIWLCTLGGYFGIGWIFEIFKISSYVRDANEDKAFIEKFRIKLRKYPRPPFSTIRFLGAIMVGYLFGELIKQAIPENNFLEIDWGFLHWLVPFGIALGVWTVGNIGREKGSFWQCLLAAYISYPIRYYIYDESWYMIIVLFFTALVFDSCSKQWRVEPKKKSGCCKRFTCFSFCVTLYLALWCSYFYFNGKVLDYEGEEIPVHEAVKHLLSSSMWAEFKDTLFEIYNYSQHRGWYEVLKELFILMDEDGIKNSYKVLDLSPTASQVEITAAWRKLSKEYHPDKQKDPVKRNEAQERFMEIQQAYEVLSKNKMKRKNRNKKFDDDL